MWETLTAIMNSPYRFPIYILGIIILWRSWPLIRILPELLNDATKASCQGLSTLVLTGVFIFFLFTNPLGLLLFVFLLTH